MDRTGWTWGRQSGVDPAELVLAPSKDLQPFREAGPTTEAARATLEKIVGTGGSEADQTQAMFNWVSDLLGAAPIPDDAFPTRYRKAVVTALQGRDGINLSRSARPLRLETDPHEHATGDR